MIDSRTYQRFTSDPAAYREALTIDVNGMPERLGEVMDDWQRDDFAALDGALLRCHGRLPVDAPEPRMRAYFERARGHSKTSDIAVVVTYLLAFAPRPLKTYAFAADRDQAGLLRDACLTLTRLNPWLGELIRVDREQVLNVGNRHPGEGSFLKIETSDVGSSYGILPDAIVFDEITHWVESAEALWSSLVSSAAKRASCVLLGIANAGFEGTWQHKLRNAIAIDEDWVFRRQEGSVASWIPTKTLDEQRRLLPSSAYLRLWKNVWSRGGGEVALDARDIAAAFRDDLSPLHGSEPAYAFVAGLDLGVSRDHSGLVVLGVRKNELRNDADQVRLAHVRRWRPAKGEKVNLMEVEDELRRVAERYSPIVAVDPWQAELLSQRLSFDGVKMRDIAPTAANLRDMATKLREVFADRRIRLYDREGLRDDIEAMQILETSYGFRLQSPRDRKGHGDVASALCNALVVAGEVTGAARRRRPRFI